MNKLIQYLKNQIWFKRTEAEIVSIDIDSNLESWAFCDSPTIQAILNIRTNSRLY